MLVVAVLACLVAKADNYFYLDDVRIPATVVGSDITVPVKASFDSYVSIWDVQFSLPAGLTLRRLKAGNDMNVSYCNIYGDEQIAVGQFSFISGVTRCVGMLDPAIDYQFNEFGEFYPCGTVKWSPGLYDEMLLLTIRVEDGFNGGDIIINTKTSCGYDTRIEPNAFSPSAPETVDGVILGDADRNGEITIADLTWYIDYISANESDYVLSGDIVHDGVNDILDVTKLRDVLLFGEWYDGYVLTQSEKVINIPKPATNYFYLDEVRIPATAVGSDITVPIKASFDTYVSIWDIQLSLPEGLTLRRLKAGNDMNVSYCNIYGDEQTAVGQFSFISGVNRCVGTLDLAIDYQFNEFGEYNPCGTVKWSPGQYDEMLLLTIRVEDGFNGGDIIINTKTSCGYDTRIEPNAFSPSAPETVDGVILGDADRNGEITIADLTWYIDYISANESDYVLSGDIVHDGVNDILDVTKLRDVLLFGEWYDGYVLTQSEKVINISEPLLYGDVNGDGFITIGDVTALIDILLYQSDYYQELADLNGDGILTIADVTILIDILLGNR